MKRESLRCGWSKPQRRACEDLFDFRRRAHAICRRKTVCSMAFIAALVFVSAAPSLPQSSTTLKSTASSESSSTGHAGALATGSPLRASTHLVQISVVVQDKKGDPVTDLSESDFRIFDQGKPQTISAFSLETTHLQPALAVPVSPNVYANRIEQPGVPTGITVILIDRLNTPSSDMSHVREQVTKFVNNLRPEDCIAIYGLTSNLTVLSDFTNDPASLVEALNQTPNKKSPQPASSSLQAASGRTVTPDVPLARPGQPDIGGTADVPASDTLNKEVGKYFSLVDGGNQGAENFYSKDRAYITAKALEAIAAHIGRLPGRKNLIWISDGFPIDMALVEIAHPTNNKGLFGDEVARAIRALNEADVAVYPLDSRVATSEPVGVMAAAPSRGRSGSGGTGTMFPSGPPQSDSDTMNLLAKRTGGRTFHGTNNIQASIRSALDDARVTYVIGYYPDHGQWNGKFRQIKIKLDRSGTKTRYRSGYYALPDEAPVDQAKADTLLYDAGTNPIDSTALNMTVTTKAVDMPGAETLETTTKLEASDFVLNHNGDRWVGTLDFLFLQVGDQDKLLDSDEHRLDLNFTQSSYERIQREGLTLPRSFRIAPGAVELRMVARDSISGATGSVTIPLLKLFPSLAGNGLQEPELHHR
jgi:VWFA-related protein